jgi:lipoprotein-anchoring transpeptidase ErfK/SrfK
MDNLQPRRKPPLMKSLLISLVLALISALVITVVLAYFFISSQVTNDNQISASNPSGKPTLNLTALQASINQQPTVVPRATMVLITATPRPTYAPEQKTIIVDISEQRLDAYQGEDKVFHFVVSTGANNNTPLGEFQILDKQPNAFSDSLGFAMPFWLGFTWIGDQEDGIHGLPVQEDGTVLWGDDLGTPVTTGCIVLSTTDAQKLYDWADVGVVLKVVE